MLEAFLFFLFGLEEAHKLQQCRRVSSELSAGHIPKVLVMITTLRIGEFRLWGFQLLQTKSHFSVLTKCKNLKKQKQLFVKIKIKYFNTYKKQFLTTIPLFPLYFLHFETSTKNVEG